MNTIKIAITIPRDLVMSIDILSREKGISRSRFITHILKEKIAMHENDKIRAVYDQVFSDEAIAKEQLATAEGFESTGKEEGQEW